MVDWRAIVEAPMVLSASAQECAALAQRFGLVAIVRLEATLALAAEGVAVTANGQMKADIVQSCAVSGDDLAVHIAEAMALRFVPARPPQALSDEEIELEAEDLDEIEFEGTAFDLGEAVAQTLALAIDPFLTGPDADRVRAEHGLDQPPAGPLADALRMLKKD